MANYDDDSYKCLCASGAYTGKHCESKLTMKFVKFQCSFRKLVCSRMALQSSVGALTIFHWFGWFKDINIDRLLCYFCITFLIVMTSLLTKTYRKLCYT